MTIIIRKKVKPPNIPPDIPKKKINHAPVVLPKDVKEIKCSKAPQPTRVFPDPNFDLTGKIFGKFTVIGAYAYKPRKWVVLCECGLHIIVDRTGLIRSCNNPNIVICKSCHKINIKLRRELPHTCEGGSHI